MIVKHANPCGVAVAASTPSAYAKALKTDPTSAFGGIIAFNGEVDRACAERVAKQFVEVLIAPSYSAEALAVFAAKANARVLQIDLPTPGAGRNTHDLKRVGSGLLIQTADNHDIARERPQGRDDEGADAGADARPAVRLDGRALRQEQRDRLLRRRHDARRRRRPDEPDRLGARSPRSRPRRPGLSLAGSAVASDAFFPFRDGLDVVIDAGAACVIQPGGSMRDDEVIAAANERGIAMVFTGVRHFRH